MFAAVLALVLLSCGGGGVKLAAAERNAAPAPKPKTGAVPWPAPKDALGRARLAGVPVDRHEYDSRQDCGKRHLHRDNLSGAAALISPQLWAIVVTA